MRCTYADFLTCVIEVWQRPEHATGLLKLVAKLKKTKVALKAWNIYTFGHVDQNIQELEERLETLEQQLQLAYNQRDRLLGDQNRASNLGVKGGDPFCPESEEKMA